MVFSGSLLLVAVVCAASLVSGRLLTGALGLDLLRRLDPPGTAASAVLGTAFCTLGFGWLSLFGLPAPRIALALAGTHLALLALCAYRGRLGVFRPRGPATSWAGLLGAALAAAVVSLLPVLRTGGFSIGNDTYTYCAFSEWLQTHGFGTPCPWDPASPVTTIPWLWQQQQYPLGAAYLLALVQAAWGAPLSLLVYPAVSAFGMVLQVAALLVVGRWVLRLTHAWATGACLAFAVLPHPTYWGHHNGFLQQTCALPVLLLAVAVLARSVSGRRWRPDTVVLIALITAYLLNVYLPIVLPLGAAGIVYLAAGLARARRRRGEGRWLAHVGAVFLLVSVLAFFDLRGVVTRFFGFAGSLVGGHVSFTAGQFLQFAMGMRVLGLHGSSVEVPVLSDLQRALTPLCLGLTVLGLYGAWRRPRARGLAAVVTLLAAALGYYALAARDPWSDQVGHTWNVFKLMQWAFPLVFLLQVAALRHLLRPLASARRPVLALLLAAPLGLLGVQWAWSESLGRSMRDIVRTDRPLADLRALQRRFRALPPGMLLVVGRPVSAHRWLAAYSALLAYPRPIVGDWTDSPSVPQGGGAPYAHLLRRLGEEGVVPLLCGFTPFQPDGFESLGGGFARLLPSDRPLVVHVVGPRGVTEDRDEGRPGFTMREGRTKLILYSPLEAAVEVRLTVRPYPLGEGEQRSLTVFLTPDDFSHRTVRAAVEGRPEAVVPLDGRTDLGITLSLPRGLVTVVLSPPPAVPLTVEGIEFRRPGTQDPARSRLPP